MNSPATARRATASRRWAWPSPCSRRSPTLLLRPGGLSTEGLIVILAGGLIGGAAGLLLALRIAMTAMPQLVSLFNAVGGGAAALVAIFDYLTSSGRPRKGLHRDLRHPRRRHRQRDVPGSLIASASSRASSAVSPSRCRWLGHDRRARGHRAGRDPAARPERWRDAGPRDRKREYSCSSSWAPR